MSFGPLIELLFKNIVKYGGTEILFKIKRFIIILTSIIILKIKIDSFIIPNLNFIFKN